jgi:hypothetical protein
MAQDADLPVGAKSDAIDVSWKRLPGLLAGQRKRLFGADLEITLGDFGRELHVRGFPVGVSASTVSA